MATPRPFGTCFFESYAQISLSALLGSEFDCLVNRDRPDLQSRDDRSIGIEVTRAMEESKKAEEALLRDIAGITPAPRGEEIDQILEYGYAYGLQEGKYIGVKELSYWSMALPLRRILESKVSKVGNGFYGRYEKMGLFVFCREDMKESEAVKAMNYTIQLQKYLDIRYNRLYLADVNDLFVCNLDDGLKESFRIVRYPITQGQRKVFFSEAIKRQTQIQPGIAGYLFHNDVFFLVASGVCAALLALIVAFMLLSTPKGYRSLFVLYALVGILLLVIGCLATRRLGGGLLLGCDLIGIGIVLVAWFVGPGVGRLPRLPTGRVRRPGGAHPRHG